MMENICAVIDAQGFIFNKCFIPREIAFVSDEFKKCVEIDTKLDYSQMNIKDIRANKYLQRNILGMTLRPYLACEYDFAKIILEMYEKSLKPGKFILGVKNHQLADILTSYNIPWVDLEKLGCPSVSSLEVEQLICWNHTSILRDQPKIRCAYGKCLCLWSWVKANLTTAPQVELESYDEVD